MAKDCAVDGCDRPLVARGYCSTHYGRWRKGKPLSGPIRAKQAQHGTRSKYKLGCRCGKCRAATSAYMREWNLKRRRERGIQPVKRGIQPVKRSEHGTVSGYQYRKCRCDLCRAAATAAAAAYHKRARDTEGPCLNGDGNPIAPRSTRHCVQCLGRNRSAARAKARARVSRVARRAAPRPN